MARSLVVAALGLTLLAVGADPVDADDGWNPFKSEPPRRPRPAAPSDAGVARETLPPMDSLDDAP